MRCRYAEVVAERDGLRAQLLKTVSYPIGVLRDGAAALTFRELTGWVSGRGRFADARCGSSAGANRWVYGAFTRGGAVGDIGP